MKSMIAGLAVLLLVTASTTSATISQAVPATGTATLPTFLKGFSSSPNDQKGVKLISSTSANSVRRYVFWNSVEPELHALNHSLTMATLKAHRQELIYDWADALDWSYGDSQIDPLMEHNSGKAEDKKVKAIIECGEGTHYGLPRFNGTLADPGVIGIDLYLAYQYRFCRAAARRYGAPKYADAVSPIWQIENELNEAFLSGLQGQRLVGFTWANWTFLTELLHVLKEAVTIEIPTAQVTMNFHTDVPKCIHETIGLPGYYEMAVANWSSIFPILSFDAYPCMFTAAPDWGDMVGQRLAKIRQNSDNPSKRIFVMETGYPVNAPGNHPNLQTDPQFNFTDANQAAYVDFATSAVKTNGGTGFLFFKLTPDVGMTAPPGGYTKEDNMMFAAIKEFLKTGKESVLIDWVLGNDGKNMEEIIKRASRFLSSPHWGWGLENGESHLRPAFDNLKTFFKAN